VSAAKGVLVVLAGGPGQAAVPLVQLVWSTVGTKVLDAYRVVVIDQRGTGGRALVCPALQRAMGSSDLTPPPPEAVRACAEKLGPQRELYSTDDVIADLDLLRRALDVDQITLYGTSYGTFVAAQYALAYPEQTRALVLDSVVPHAGIDPLAVDVMQATRRVLREACAAARCKGDPVGDLAKVVARENNGVDLLDLVTMMSVADPTFTQLFGPLRAAARGSPAQLDEVVRRFREGFRTSAEQLSQGLHASALCSDLRFPWGTSAAPLAGRAAAAKSALKRLSRKQLAPFDAATARGNGFLLQCLPWPPVPAAPLKRGGDLPDVPTLLLAGTRDLSTPLEWAEREAAHAPGGKLLVVQGSGHAVAIGHRKGRAALRSFLLRGAEK
jgi:pimeloyl-ACP methyl ester carboxylesterase